jgi:hypothetical protein
MSTTQLSCTISASNPTVALGVEVWLDNQQLYNADHFSHETLPLSWDITDSDGEHELRFILKNKTTEHTKIDDAGNIVTDATISIDNLAFDEIELNQIFYNHAVYAHDFNGTGDDTTAKFYGTMGCNGTVSLKFTTPIYLWLLESM